MTSRTPAETDPPEDDVGRPLRGDELRGFLGLGLVARLACLDRDGWPYGVPVWHEWDGSGFWVIAAKNAAWARFLAHDPRVALTVDEPETLRRVLCQGTAVHNEGPTASGRWNSIARRMAERYLGLDAVAAYEAKTAGLERWLFRIEPRRLVGWQGAGRADRDEQRTGRPRWTA